MLIPQWVDTHKRSNNAKSRARLRYVLANIAAKHTGRQSMRALAEHVGVDHSTLSTYVRRGGCSTATAKRIIDTFPDCGLSIENLVNPMTLSVGTSRKP